MSMRDRDSCEGPRFPLVPFWFRTSFCDGRGVPQVGNVYPASGLGAARPMKVKDLRPESKVDVIELVVREKGSVRDFTSRSGSAGKVCDSKAVDDDGDEIGVSLWNDEIERVQANDRIRITNGWVREWRGNMQVSAGRFGKLEILK